MINTVPKLATISGIYNHNLLLQIGIFFLGGSGFLLSFHTMFSLVYTLILLQLHSRMLRITGANLKTKVDLFRPRENSELLWVKEG